MTSVTVNVTPPYVPKGHRVVWDSLTRQKMVVRGRAAMVRGEVGYSDNARVDTGNKAVGPLSKPMKATDIGPLLKARDRVKKRMAKERAMAKPVTHNESFERELNAS